MLARKSLKETRHLDIRCDEPSKIYSKIGPLRGLRLMMFRMEEDSKVSDSPVSLSTTAKHVCLCLSGLKKRVMNAFPQALP